MTATHAVLLLLALLIRPSLSQQPVAIRLVGGTSQAAGRLELMSCAWANVCGAGFSTAAAVVACRQLGLGVPTRITGSNAGDGTGPILMSHHKCLGAEAALDECSKTDMTPYTTCSHYGDVSVWCSEGEATSQEASGPGSSQPEQGTLRLVVEPSQSRVEIYQCGWATVCSKAGGGFSDASASVACRQLGLGGNGSVVSGFGPGTGLMWTTNFECSGSETSLELCPNSTTISICSHADDVAISCGGAPASPATLPPGSPASRMPSPPQHSTASQPDSQGSSGNNSGGSSTDGSSSSSPSSSNNSSDTGSSGSSGSENSSSSSSSSSGANPGVIAGAVLGSVLVIGLLGLLVWRNFVRKRRARRLDAVAKQLADDAKLEGGSGRFHRASGSDSTVKPSTPPITRTSGGLESSSQGLVLGAEEPSRATTECPPTPSPMHSWGHGMMVNSLPSSAQTGSGSNIELVGHHFSTAPGLGHWAPMGDSMFLEARLKMMDFSNIQIIEQLGQGQLGKAFLARWREILVVVKVLEAAGAGDSSPEACSGQGPQDRVAQALQKHSCLLASLRHPSLVSFLGMCADPPSVMMEHCPRGCLAEVLRAAATSPEVAAELGWLRRLQMLLEAARGMLYLHLHKPPVLHLSLHSSNLLIDQDWTLKVADFNLESLMKGIAAGADDKSHKLPWVAPEVLGGDANATPAADSFSFGIVMFEMLTWQLPWRGTSPEEIARAVAEGGRPPIPEPASLQGGTFAGLADYIALMQRCWAQIPQERPDFGGIIASLRAILEAAGGTDEVVLWSPFALQLSSSNWIV